MRLALCLALAGLSPSAAAAVTITVSFTATIDEVGSEVASAFTVGDAISGSIQIDAATPDSNGDPALGLYPSSIDDLSFDFGGYLASANFGQVSVANGASDTFVATTSNASGASVAGLALVTATLNLVDSDGSVFASAAMPTSLSLADFGFARASLQFEGGLTSRRVAGTLSSLTVTVPEPSALVLLALGGLALLGARKATSRTPPASSPSPARTPS